MSQPNWKTPLILAVVLAVGGPALYWYEYTQKPKNEEQEEKSKRLFRVNELAVTKLALRAGPTASYVFECADLAQKLCKPGDNSKWEITAPSRLKGDDSSVNGLLSALNNLTPIETIELKDETEEKRKALLAEYQLDDASRANPAVTKRIDVTAADGKVQRVYFGDTHPISDGLFAATFAGEGADEKLVGTKVEVVPNYFKSNFDKDLTYWREKRILALNAPQVKRFELAGSHGLLIGEREGAGWKLTGGSATDLAGDSENIDSLLTAAAFLTARDFAAENQASPEGRKALAGATKALTLNLFPEKAEEKAALTLYRKGKGDQAPLFAVATGRDPVYGLEPSTLARFDKKLTELRQQKLITSTDRFGTRRIEVAGSAWGDAPKVVEQKDGKWALAGGGELNPDRPGQLLERLTGNRITAFLTGRDIPAGEKDGITLKLVDEKGQPLRHLAFWSVKAAGKDAKTGPGADAVYARDLLSKRPEAFRVDTALKDALPWAADYFAKRDALGGAPAAETGAAGSGADDHHGHEH
jgi:hypothetical protein